LNYPTIVNNIPKDTNLYQNTLSDFALIDNKLAASQLAIGESSNLAQICLTYTYNFNNKKFDDYVCILSVLAQCSIDNAKRQFDIDLIKEIKRIKSSMEIKKHKYPLFWLLIKKDFKKNNINTSLICPMNYLYNLKINELHASQKTLPMSSFFIKHKMNENRQKCKKVEELIQRFSLKLFESTKNCKNVDESDYLLLRSDFSELIKNIRGIYISKNYVPLMSWLIDRAFMVTPQIKRNTHVIKSTIHNNKSILMKTLYEINSDAFLKCFTKK